MCIKEKQNISSQSFNRNLTGLYIPFQNLCIPSRFTLVVFDEDDVLFFCSSRSIAQCKLRAIEGYYMSSESPLRVRDGNEGVGGRDGREKCYPNEVIDWSACKNVPGNGVRCCLHFCLRQLSTVEARFSGHRISGKPRFKGKNSSQNLRDHFWL